MTNATKDFPRTFEGIRSAGTERSAQWHEGGAPWSGADWSNAMMGEVGEVAEAVEFLVNDVIAPMSRLTLLTKSSGRSADLVKKLRREETGLGNIRQGTKTYDDRVKELAKELADVYLYMDLLAAHYGIDLGVAVAEKFNEVSVDIGFPQRIQT